MKVFDKIFSASQPSPLYLEITMAADGSPLPERPAQIAFYNKSNTAPHVAVNSIHKILTQCWLNDKPTSSTLAHHQASPGSKYICTQIR